MTFFSKEHLKRYRDIAGLLIKYGRSDLVKKMGLEAELPDAAEGGVADHKAEELVHDLQARGPTFVKMGQLASTQTDLLPEPYAQALFQLQDELDSFPFSDVQRIIQNELDQELESIFIEFEPEPVAAASLGQVHRARLQDGRPVAVKIQRPGIHKQIAEDMAVMHEIATLIDKSGALGGHYDLTGKACDFRQSIYRELDYRQEAHNLSLFKSNLSRFDSIVVPGPVDEFTTSRILTMDYIDGSKIISLSPERRRQLDGAALAEELFHAYLQQILVDGLVHIDPHPGNVYVTDDGKLLLLDFGMTGHVSPQMQNELVKLLLSVSDGRGGDAADVAIRLGTPTPHFQPGVFRHDISALVARYQHATLEELSVGSLVLQISRISAKAGNELPPQFIMLAKTLIKLDQVGKELAPSFSPNASVKRNMTELMARRMRGNFSLSKFYQSVLELTELAQTLPFKIGAVFDSIARNEFRMHVDAIDEQRLIEGIQKIANRITVGLLLAALIIGAALLMRIESDLTIFGYPAIAIVLFLGAAVGGILLILDILWSDRKSKLR